MKTINLTQHPSTAEQKVDGVFDSPRFTDEIRKLLTFDEKPSFEDMERRAFLLTNIALDEDADAAMIGGAPYFMPILEKGLLEYGIKPVYSFSKRVSEEKVLEDGTVTKVSVFKHEGFIVANPNIYR